MPGVALESLARDGAELYRIAPLAELHGQSECIS